MPPIVIDVVVFLEVGDQLAKLVFLLLLRPQHHESRTRPKMTTSGSIIRKKRIRIAGGGRRRILGQEPDLLNEVRITEWMSDRGGSA